ncbi:hypothetical protein M0804_008363 [Polistes exclamans]|nr:hypothetical protein M0804_008363 [Polistes exclamans]
MQSRKSLTSANKIKRYKKQEEEEEEEEEVKGIVSNIEPPHSYIHIVLYIHIVEEMKDYEDLWEYLFLFIKEKT